MTTNSEYEPTGSHRHQKQKEPQQQQQQQQPGTPGAKPRPTVCDCCRIRRIKCDGLEPCWRCITSGLKCTFSAARKRGPRGNGSAVLKLLRQRQGVDSPASTSASAGLSSDPTVPRELTWKTFPQDAIATLIDAYFEYINPIVPIIEKDQVLEYLKSPPTEETYALIASLAAVPLKRVTLTNNDKVASNSTQLRDLLISEALRIKGTLPFIQKQNSVDKAKVSFFLYLTFCGSEDFETAWYYLHESVMIAKIMKLDDESSYRGLKPEEDLDRRIFYWGLFVSDRGFSIHEHKPCILHKTINLPRMLPSGKASMYNEFVSLIKVMASMEDGFITAWVDGRSNKLQGVVSRIQSQLLSAVSSAPKFESGIQKSNVLITQPWLLLLLWKMCKNTGQESANGNSNSALFPAYIAKLATQVSSTVSVQDLLAHGPGMRKKFYDIGFALAESVLSDPQATHASNIDIKNVLHKVVDMAGSLSLNNNRQFKLLENKAGEAIQEMEAARMGWVYTSELVNDLFDWSYVGAQNSTSTAAGTAGSAASGAASPSSIMSVPGSNQYISEDDAEFTDNTPWSLTPPNEMTSATSSAPAVTSSSSTSSASFSTTTFQIPNYNAPAPPQPAHPQQQLIGLQLPTHNTSTGSFKQEPIDDFKQEPIDDLFTTTNSPNNNNDAVWQT